MPARNFVGFAYGFATLRRFDQAAVSHGLVPRGEVVLGHGGALVWVAPRAFLVACDAVWRGLDGQQ